MTGYCIVDVCGTLVKDDTTIGLLYWHFARHRRWRLWLLWCLTARLSPARLLIAIAEKTAGKHLLKYGLVRLLKGDAIADVKHSAAQYADWLLGHRRVEQVSVVLASSHTKGALVLASASLEPIVQALASRLNAEFVASSLATDDGRHLGRYCTDLTGKKMEALDERLSSAWRRRPYIAISDNLTDRALLEGAQVAYVVLHRALHRARWAGMDAVFLSAC